MQPKCPSPVGTDGVRHSIFETFVDACKAGRLDVAKSLAELAGLTTKDVRGNYDAPLWESCVAGHLEVAKWLVETFYGPNPEYEWTVVCHLVKKCFELGRANILPWLAETFRYNICIKYDVYLKPGEDISHIHVCGVNALESGPGLSPGFTAVQVGLSKIH